MNGLFIIPALIAAVVALGANYKELITLTPKNWRDDDNDD
jgi:hypothetical protein